MSARLVHTAAVMATLRGLGLTFAQAGSLILKARTDGKPVTVTCPGCLNADLVSVTVQPDLTVEKVPRLHIGGDCWCGQCHTVTMASDLNKALYPSFTNLPLDKV